MKVKSLESYRIYSWVLLAIDPPIAFFKSNSTTSVLRRENFAVHSDSPRRSKSIAQVVRTSTRRANQHKSLVVVLAYSPPDWPCCIFSSYIEAPPASLHQPHFSRTFDPALNARNYTKNHSAQSISTTRVDRPSENSKVQLRYCQVLPLLKPRTFDTHCLARASIL